MNLEILLNRAKEIETAIVNVANQYQALLGHKTEVNHWITELQKVNPVEETKVDENVAKEDEVPVE